jgi:hypothetical protein
MIAKRTASSSPLFSFLVERRRHRSCAPYPAPHFFDEGSKAMKGEKQK